jgi:hypothetical protein
VNAPGTVREALIAEAIGDLGRLIDQTQTLQPAMTESRQAFLDAHAQLANHLAAFEGQIAALSEKAKVQTVKHILVRTDEAARRSIDSQGRAMADAARVAFQAELIPTLQRLQRSIQPLIERQERRWEPLLTHAAAAVTGSAVTGALALMWWTR